MKFAFYYQNGRHREFAEAEEFLAALARRRTAEAMITMYTRHGSSLSASAETVEEAQAIIAEFEAKRREIDLSIRRPHLWAELRPAEFRAHMVQRPKGHPRPDWAERIADRGLDDKRTIEEQVAAIQRDDPERMRQHMAQRPSGHPRPAWALRIIPEPAGGYGLYDQLVFKP